MPVSRRVLLTAAVATVPAVLLAGCGDDGDPPAAGQIKRVPADQRVAAPKVTGELLTGGDYDLADQVGKVVVINFWGSWCAPCRLEAADLETVYQATKDDGVEFLGINVLDERDPARAFVAERNTYPSIFDPAGRVALTFPDIPSAPPTTVIIDRQGRIAAMVIGIVLQDKLQPLVEEIAAEAA